MCSDKDWIPQCHAEEAWAGASPSTRSHSARVCEYLLALQPCHFTRAITGPEYTDITSSPSDLSALSLEDFPWVEVQTSLLFLLGLLLLGALSFIWKLLWEKDRECQTKEKLQRELSWRKAQKVDAWRKARTYAAPGAWLVGPCMAGALVLSCTPLQKPKGFCVTKVAEECCLGELQEEKDPELTNVTLDPDTAHFELFLSEDHRSVRRIAIQQNLPEKPGRFFVDPCVLGHAAFSSGRCYWEVEVGDRTYWELGVCEENMERTWAIKESPQNGIWSLERYVNKYHALTSPRTLLPLSEPPRQVGIFLDYEAGEVSFFSVTDGSHIYTFSQASFSGRLRPFFCLWFDDPTPLTICN